MIQPHAQRFALWASATGKLDVHNNFDPNGRCKRKAGTSRSPGLQLMVARTRFELVISALRGRRPEPLDERAEKEMAGMERIELPLTEPESAVLPLDDGSSFWGRLLGASSYFTSWGTLVQA